MRRCSRCGVKSETRYFDGLCLCEACAKSRWIDGLDEPASKGQFAWSSQFPKSNRAYAPAFRWSKR